MRSFYVRVSDAVAEHFEDRIFTSADLYELPEFKGEPKLNLRIAAHLRTLESNNRIERLGDLSEDGLIRWRCVGRTKHFSIPASILLQHLLVDARGAIEFLGNWGSKDPSVIHHNQR